MFLNIIAQGKLITSWGFCTKEYGIGVALFSIFYAGVVISLYCWTKK